MSYFKQADFKGEVVERISVVINHKMGLPILHKFSNLNDMKKRKYNRILNEYISDLGKHENWKELLEKEFNEIVLEDLLDEKFRPEKIVIPMTTITPSLLMTKEQQEFLESEEALKYDFSKDFKIEKV